MPTLSHAQTLVIGAVVAPLLFLASVHLTRARARHVAGAALASIAYGLATFCWDRVAAVAGWWRYPYDPSATGQVLGLDLLAGLVAGGAFGLLGARLTAHFGVPGLVGFLVGWTAWGVLHDMGGAALFASSNLMTFSAGPIPALADALNYLSCGALAQVVIRLVAGAPAPTRSRPATSAQDRSRRPHRHHAHP